MIFDKKYWQERWTNGEIGWDIGYPSTPIKEYIDQLTDKNIRILIPGCGNGHEAEYLFSQGFENTYVIDIAQGAIDSFKKRIDLRYHKNVIWGDFFEHNGSYDLILEQTFFCAINKDLRAKYIRKMSELLQPNGQLVGLLFNIPLFEDHPPFGGSKDAYIPMFEEKFDIIYMDTSYNSIPERAENELFIRMKPKV